MKVKSVYSTKTDAKSAVNEIKEKMGNEFYKFIIYFASSNYDPGRTSAEMKAAFPGSGLIGCTTAGELVSGKMLKNSVVAMGWDDSLIEDFEIVSVPDIKQLPSSISKFESKFGKKLKDLEYDKYFGLILVDGLSGLEEKFMDELGNLTDIVFIGGSAGDDLKFQSTFLFNGDSVVRSGAVLALIKPKAKFGFIKTQSFKILDKKLLPTKVNEANREVIEFNHCPAAEFYAGMLNTKKENIQDHFMKNPVGLVVDDNPFVRSPQNVNGSSIKFYCNIKEGVELNLLESADIIDDTKKAIEDYKKENGQITALVNFNCILRTLELENKGLCENYGNIFKSVPTIGFSTYGEEFIGHINQTSTILVLR